MTYSSPSFDYYDDGLVHSHDWSRSTPPGGHHADEVRRQSPGFGRPSADRKGAQRPAQDV